MKFRVFFLLFSVLTVFMWGLLLHWSHTHSQSVLVLFFSFTFFRSFQALQSWCSFLFFFFCPTTIFNCRQSGSSRGGFCNWDGNANEGGNEEGRGGGRKGKVWLHGTEMNQQKHSMSNLAYSPPQSKCHSFGTKQNCQIGVGGERRREQRKGRNSRAQKQCQGDQNRSKSSSWDQLFTFYFPPILKPGFWPLTKSTIFSPHSVNNVTLQAIHCPRESKE